MTEELKPVRAFMPFRDGKIKASVVFNDFEIPFLKDLELKNQLIEVEIRPAQTCNKEAQEPSISHDKAESCNKSEEPNILMERVKSLELMLQASKNAHDCSVNHYHFKVQQLEKELEGRDLTIQGASRDTRLMSETIEKLEKENADLDAKKCKAQVGYLEAKGRADVLQSQLDNTREALNYVRNHWYQKAVIDGKDWVSLESVLEVISKAAEALSTLNASEKEEEPTAEECLNWLGDHVQEIKRVGSEFWLIYNDYDVKGGHGNSLLEAIRCAMANEKKESR